MGVKIKGEAGFIQWMRQVDKHVGQAIWMSANDLPDQPYRDWYDDNVSPQRAAKMAIKNAAD